MPSVTISVPTQPLHGTVAVQVSASGNPGTTYLSIDGTQVAFNPSKTWSYMWDTTKASNANHVLHASTSYPNGPATVDLTVAVNNTVAPPTNTPPSNTALPVVSGTAVLGSLLTGSSGSWTGSPTPTYSYQWLRCQPFTGGTQTPIAGATGTSYTVVAADVGYQLRVKVTAMNVAGTAVATSLPTGTVPASVGPTTPILDAFGGTLASWLNEAAHPVQITNAAAAAVGSGGGGIWWNGTSPAWSDGEFYFTIPVLPASAQWVVARWRAKNSTRTAPPTDNSNYTGYYATITPSAGTILVKRADPSSGTQLGSTLTGLSLPAGTSVWIKHVGSTITVSTRQPGGAWTTLGTFTDGTYPDGSHGVFLSDTTVRVDDYGGGSFGTAPATVTSDGAFLVNAVNPRNWYTKVDVLFGVNPTYDANSPTLVADWAAGQSNTLLTLRRYTTPIFHADANTPKYDVALTYYPPAPYFRQVPIPDGAAADPGGDGHMIVIDHSTGCMYDFWQASKNLSTGQWSASVCIANAYPSPGQYSNAAARASGIPLLLGMVRPEELIAGVIPHAIGFAAANQGNQVQLPTNGGGAWFTSGTSTGSHAVHCGIRARLDPAFDVTTITDPYQRIIAKALQDYGMIMVDGTTGLGITFGGAGPGSAWSAVPGLTSGDYFYLTQVPMNRLKVLLYSTRLSSPPAGVTESNGCTRYS